MKTVFEHFGATHVGLVRNNNEDSFALLPEQGFFILADGMGGHNAGEVASLEAVKDVCQSIEHLKPSLSIEGVSQALRRAVEKANQHVWELSRTQRNLSGMGTTLSCFLIREGCLIYAHVGDSRIYRIHCRNGSKRSIEQLTRDHSLRAELIEKGELDEATGENFPFKNVITRALGTTPHILPDVGILSVSPGDLYLICSDGLTDLVSNDQILQILQEEIPLFQATDKLVEAALQQGGQDNITILVVKIL